MHYFLNFCITRDTYSKSHDIGSKPAKEIQKVPLLQACKSLSSEISSLLGVFISSHFDVNNCKVK